MQDPHLVAVSSPTLNSLNSFTEIRCAPHSNEAMTEVPTPTTGGKEFRKKGKKVFRKLGGGFRPVSPFFGLEIENRGLGFLRVPIFDLEMIFLEKMMFHKVVLLKISG